jgi:hypothetical protein
LDCGAVIDSFTIVKSGRIVDSEVLQMYHPLSLMVLACYRSSITKVGTIPPPAVTFANSDDERRVNAEPTSPL